MGRAARRAGHPDTDQQAWLLHTGVGDGVGLGTPRPAPWKMLTGGEHVLEWGKAGLSPLPPLHADLSTSHARTKSFQLLRNHLFLLGTSTVS